MGFESGVVSFRVFQLSRGLPPDVIERFAAAALPAFTGLDREPVEGWVGHRHLLDRQINETSARTAGYLHLGFVRAERKVPPALLRAECRMEELAQMQARNLAFLARRERIQIRKDVAERLLPSMPPTLQAVDVAVDHDAGHLYATCTGTRQAEMFAMFFKQTTGVGLVALDPDHAAMRLAQVNTRDLSACSFSPDADDALAGHLAGHDFLTWLWFHTETRHEQGAALDLGPAGRFACLLEGPLTFFHEGDGAYEATLRRGQPTVSAEAKAALLAGKKLKRARLTLARDDRQWTLTVDADDFVLRAVKLPEGDVLDAASRFQDRMLALRTLQAAFYGLYEQFLAERSDARRWQHTRRDIHAWVRDRQSRG
jgi:hypothetical protein